MGLIPPWCPSRGFKSGYYDFLLSGYTQSGYVIDITRLFIQWVTVAIGTFGIMWVLKDSNQRSQKCDGENKKDEKG